MGSFENYTLPEYYIVLLIMYQWARPRLFLGFVCLFPEDHMQKWVFKKQKIEKAVTSLKQGDSENSSHLVGAGNVETLHPT